MGKIVLIGLLALLAGCDLGSQYSEPVPELPPNSASSSTLELRPMLPAEARPVGVAITPSGRRYVLDQRSGFYEVSSLGARLVLNVSGLSGVELTDVVALDDNRFAFTAENDGFLFDLRTNDFVSYFCYLPSQPSPPQEEPMAGTAGGPAVVPVATPLSISQTLELQGVEVKQRTESVAYNPDTLQLFAQPRTFRLDTGAIAGSELFVFNDGGGEPVRVVPMASATYVAGGMATVPGDRLLLGVANRIDELSLQGELRPLRALDSAIDIAGMARTPSGELWILDGAAPRLLRIDGVL
jgi:hypothetical protein